MNQTIKVEAYSKDAREDRNGNLSWGCLYKGNWINVHRQQEPRKGESISGNLEEQKDKNGKSWWHLWVPIENPPKLAPESAPFKPVEPSTELQRFTFEQALIVIDQIGERIKEPEAMAAVIQTVIIQMSLGNIVAPQLKDPMQGDAHDEGGPIPDDPEAPPWER